MERNATHIMIDLETLSTLPNAQILTIGACYINDPEFWASQFYGKISQHDPIYGSVDHFSVEAKTLEWWNNQPQEIMSEAFSGTKFLADVLQEFSQYLKDLKGDGPLYVWSKSTAFDLAILRYAFNFCGMKLPWSYKNERDYRTLAAHYPNVPYIQAKETMHNALYDCVSQAQHLNKIVQLNKLKLS